MKLRIRGNSVRLRLTRPEVAALAAKGVVEERTEFADGRALVYRLEAAEVGGASAECGAFALTVRIPRGEVQRWADGPAVGIEGAQPLDGGGVLTILVEKDFECLDRPAESEEGAYPNPSRVCAPKP